jgi:hypothetical protein
MSISPTSGIVDTVVTITGTNLRNATQVKFGNTVVAGWTCNDDGTVIVTSAPLGEKGTVDVRVTNADGTSATSAADQFTYTANTEPLITAISPSSGPRAGNTEVTITGLEFGQAQRAVFGADLPGGSGLSGGTFQFGSLGASGIVAFLLTLDSATQVRAVSPPGAAAGAVEILVLTKAGSSQAAATSTTVGTGDFTLIVTPRFVRLDRMFGTGSTPDVFAYYIWQDSVTWEKGTGHMSDANTLVRDTVTSNSLSTLDHIDFPAGTKTVTATNPAALFTYTTTPPTIP